MCIRDSHGTDTDIDTDAPIVYSTRLHVCTCASLANNLARILARKSARVGRVGGQVGEDVRVGVAVGVGPMEFKL